MWQDFSDAFIYFPDDPFKLLSIWLFAVGQVRGGLRWSDGDSIRESWEIWPEEPDGRISRIAQTTQSSGRHWWNASNWWDRLLLEGLWDGLALWEGLRMEDKGKSLVLERKVEAGGRNLFDWTEQAIQV